jgi:superfamily II DNA/RNA helicase
MRVCEQGLFSATQTQEVEHLARAGLRNPLRVGVKVRTKGAQVKNQKIPLTYVIVDRQTTILSSHARHAQAHTVAHPLTCQSETGLRIGT